MRSLSVLFVLCMSLVAHAQLAIPDRVDPYEPIVAGCECIIPANGEAQFRWKLDEHCKGIQSPDGKKMYIWSPPGTHEISLFVTTETYQKLLVWVPDPANPNDISKAKLQEIKILLNFDTQEYSKTFTVGPAPPPPGPPGPPTPTDDFATQAQIWMKAIPSTVYTKDKMTRLADCWSSVASQAAATSGWDLAAFTAATKQKVQTAISTADIAAMQQPFFSPLYDYQAKLFDSRKLTTTDVPGLVKLWNDTADAIRKAAF